MSLYLDTSVIVAIFAKESNASHLAILIDQDPISKATISSWNLTEFAAAINFKFCQGNIDATFEIAQNTMFNLIPVDTADFNRAATFANQHDLRLRGGDALHLGIAAGRKLRILTLDKRMKAAARTLGISVVELD